MASCAARAAAAADSSLGISRLRPCGWESEAGDGVGALERASGNRRRGQPRRSAATSPRGSVRTERGQASVDVKQARTGGEERRRLERRRTSAWRPAAGESGARGPECQLSSWLCDLGYKDEHQMCC
ncbi:Os01g0855850 [Oryza sativa Japonica Group]|uniref:Os01g0855850 protein n=1 Tax=Oryza sativa subsp. japonica TaxID=39947 RepID=A0A0N7KE32_ORYSJ|nr:Os01g0855850 [Oryza sativa Japonica Group]